MHLDNQKLNLEFLRHSALKSKSTFYSSLFFCSILAFTSKFVTLHPTAFFLMAFSTIIPSIWLSFFNKSFFTASERNDSKLFIHRLLRFRTYSSIGVSLLICSVFATDNFLSYAGFIAALGWAIHHEEHVAICHPIRRVSYAISALIIVLPLLGFLIGESSFSEAAPVFFGALAYGISVALKTKHLHEKFIQLFEAQSSLREESQRIENLIDLIPAHVSWFDSHMNYLLVNKSLAQLQKKQKSDFVGKKIGFQSKADNELLQQMYKFVEDTDLQESYFELSINTEQGPRWHEFYLKKIRPQEHTESFDSSFEVVMLGLDREEERKVSVQLEEQRVRNLHSARLASLGEMGAGIAHEIKNPLTIILGQVAFCKKELGLASISSEKLLLRVDKIEQTAYRILKIIEGLRKLSRDSTTQELSWTPVDEILTDPINLVSEKLRIRGVSLEVINDLQGYEILCQPLQIAQVILNLVNNADDIVKNQEDKKIILKAFRFEKQFVLSVQDNGPGVKDENKLFTPFYTTKDPGSGTGLGLSISKKILEKNGGTLVYERTDNLTGFLLVFPENSGRPFTKTSQAA
jgi:signal transduction histidine kinase